MALHGRVNRNLEAIIDIAVGSPSGPRQTVSSVVDTGFTGYLTLSKAVISSLGLASRQLIQAQFADGSFAWMRTFLAEVDWLGRSARIIVCEGDGGPLLGMAMFEDYRLVIDAVQGGDVTISPLR